MLIWNEDDFQTLVVVREITFESREVSFNLFAFLNCKSVKILHEILCENVSHITKKNVKSTASGSYKDLEKMRPLPKIDHHGEGSTCN